MRVFEYGVGGPQFESVGIETVESDVQGEGYIRTNSISQTTTTLYI